MRLMDGSPPYSYFLVRISRTSKGSPSDMHAVRMVIAMIVNMVAIAFVSPIAMLPGILVFLAGAWCGNVYMKAQLPVKRMMSNKKAPVLGHFGAAISGLSMPSLSTSCACQSIALTILIQLRSVRTVPKKPSGLRCTSGSKTICDAAGCTTT